MSGQTGNQENSIYQDTIRGQQITPKVGGSLIYSGGEAYRDHPIDITILSGLNFDSLGSRFKLAVGEYELERSDVFNPIVPQYF